MHECYSLWVRFTKKLITEAQNEEKFTNRWQFANELTKVASL